MVNRGNIFRCAASATTSLRHWTSSSTSRRSTARAIGLWGTSLGGMNVVRVAAARDDIAVAIVQCPIVHGPGAARRLGLQAALRADARHRRGRRAARDTTRPPLRADRRSAGESRDGDGARRRSRLELDAAAGRWIRQPDRRRRRGGDGDDVGAAACAQGQRAAAGLRVRPREPDGSRASQRWSRAALPDGVAQPLRLRPFRRSTTRRSSATCSPIRPRSCRSTSMSTRDLLRTNDLRFLRFAATLTPRRVGRAQSLSRLDQPRRAGTSGRRLRLRPALGRRRDAGRHRGSFDGANTALARRLARDAHSRRPARRLRATGRTGRADLGALPARGCCSAITSPTNSTSAWRSIVSPTILADALDRGAQYASVGAESIRARIRNSRGLRFVATDVDWTHGDRAARRGPRRRVGVRAGQPARACRAI